MTTPCAVSILVPVCNVERYVRHCLESLVLQTLEDIQIICIDDGSTDSSPEILEEFRRIDDRVEVISKPNSGYGDSMNKGLEQARGEYIGIVESDDFASAEMFEELYRLAKQNDADVVKGNFLEHVNGRAPQDDTPVDNLGDGPFETVFCPLDHQGVFLWRPAIWSGLYKTSFLKENGIRFLPTPGASFQDTSFNFKVFAAAKRAYLTKSAYLHYRIDNANSSVKSMKKVFCICDEYKEIWRFAHERGLDGHSLGKLIPFIQYGGYRWNLDRLTPGLQLGFYQTFVKEFIELRNKGLLSEKSFNGPSWRDLSEMLADPEGFFPAHYGPKRVESSFFLLLEDARDAERAMLEAVSAIGGDDELFCACASPDGAFRQAVQNARSKDKRIFDADEAFASAPSALVDIDQVRGSRVGVIAVRDGSIDRPALDGDIAALRGLDACKGESFDGAALRGFTKEFLASLDAPLFLSLMANGFYAPEVATESTSAWAPKITGECALADYRASQAALSRLLDYANRKMEGVGFAERKRLIDKIGPLWLAVRDLYRGLGYTDRIEAGEAPSPKTLDAAILEDGAEDGSTPTLSVIVPVYNAGSYLQGCLDSVLSQSLRDIEVVCVDDGSSDDSLSQLVERQKADGRLRIATQVNGGAGNARNRGIELSRGRWLAFIDPDDYYPDEGTLQRLVDAAEGSGAELCGGSFSTVYPDGSVKDRFSGMQAFYTFRKEGFRTPDADQTDYGWIRFIYRRDLLVCNGIRFPEMQWYEDPLFFTQVLEAAGRYYAIPDAVYRYREDHKPQVWTVGKTRDLLKGIALSMDFAKERGYARMYTTLIKRLDEDYYPALVENISDDEVFCRLSAIQASLDLNLIASARESKERFFVLRALKDLKDLKVGSPAIVRMARRFSKSRAYKSIQSIRERFGD